jgi:1,4-dihydroxy-2-naphthoyl-CoA synthase
VNANQKTGHCVYQLTKRLLNETVGEQLETQLAAGAVMRATSCTTEAATEGLAAYAEQRPPVWW